MAHRNTAWLWLGLSSCAPAPGSAPLALAPTVTEAATATPNERVVLPLADARAIGCAVLAALDDDADARLTVDDASADGVWPRSVSAAGRELEFGSLPEASRFVQDVFGRLRDAEQSGSTSVEFEPEQSRSSAAEFLYLQIRERYFRGLTRRITTDAASLSQVLGDEKVGSQGDARLRLCENGNEPEPPSKASQALPLYVPESDPETLRRFTAFAKGHPEFVVRAVPRGVDARWVEGLTRSQQHGLLMLVPDAPYVVPGGRFNEMYGWDSFFITWGLAATNQPPELLRAMADHQRYQIEHYGRILNANRTYYLTRSQPPFFTGLVNLAWQASSAPWRASPEDTLWFARQASAAIREYESVWSSAPHTTPLCAGDTCLARYHGDGRGEPPEVEPGHFDWMYQRVARDRRLCSERSGSPRDLALFARCANRVRERHLAGALRSKELDAFFVHDRCMRESGHDTSYRWYGAKEGDRCADFAPVELNVLLLRYELDLAAWAWKDGAARWCERAARRARLINDHLWDEARGLYLDHDVARAARHDYVSATTLYPLWIGTENACGIELVSRARADRLVASALPLLERPGGLSASAKESLTRVSRATVVEVAGETGVQRELGRQWDYPNGWAPHQMIAWHGLDQHGFHDAAERLRYAWLFTIVKNAADFHGTVPEKFDVEKRSHRVFQEYGNVGTDFAYITEEGFGWMNASFVVGWQAIDEASREALRRLVAPEAR